MAGLTPRLPVRSPRALGALAALTVAFAFFGPSVALAADPSAPPEAGTCAARYPDAGPAGVDLRLGCMVSELVGAYVRGQASDPPALSTYAMGLGLALGVAILAFVLASRLLRARAGRRLAPVVPAEWWQCPTCRSINAASAGRCYACGAARVAGPTLTSDETPATPQSFGRGKHG